MVHKIVLAAACAGLLLGSGCKKSHKPKPAPPAPAAKTTDTGSSAQPGATAGTGSSAQPGAAKPAEAAPDGGAPIASEADYDARGGALIEGMTALFAADGKDCDKLAADLSKFIDDHQGDFAATTAYEKAHPGQKKAFDNKVASKTKAFMAKAKPSLTACKGNASLRAAMEKLPD